MVGLFRIETTPPLGSRPQLWHSLNYRKIQHPLTAVMTAVMTAGNGTQVLTMDTIKETSQNLLPVLKIVTHTEYAE